MLSFSTLQCSNFCPSPFTGWGFSPLLALLSLNDFCRFCSVPSSRTWVAWRCPPLLDPWPPGRQEPSGCPPAHAHPLWKTWTALWPYWRTDTQLWGGCFVFSLQQLTIKIKFYSTYFIHSSFRHSRQWDTTSTDRFSLDSATSSLFNRDGPGKNKYLTRSYHVIKTFFVEFVFWSNFMLAETPPHQVFWLGHSLCAVFS